MAKTNKDTFNVLDMANEYASANDMDLEDLFMTDDKDAKEEPKAEAEIHEPPKTTKSNKKKPWVPDASLTDGMSELSNKPVTYSKEEYKDSEETFLKDITEETAKNEAIESMDEMSRKLANIEEAKKRHGIVNFQIPAGQYHASIFAAAGDTNRERAQKALDEIFDEIEKDYPEFIRDWAPGFGPNKEEKKSAKKSTKKTLKVADPDGNITEFDNDIEVVKNTPKEEVKEEVSEEPTEETPVMNIEIKDAPEEVEETQIIIDKTQLPELSFTEEELDKVRKSRYVELKIVENRNIDYSNIEVMDGNAIDNVLAEQYQRKTNDLSAPLPSSKYRATFTGLSYTEVMDLSNSQELNTYDGERKKWSIAFNHTKNPSIGPWEEYKWYIDPLSKVKVKIKITDPIPNNIGEDDVHVVTKFDDFLMKTSFLDLEYILWKVLCATTLDKEIISIDCHANVNGKPCNNNYDWIYNPSDLLQWDEVEPAVLEEMKKTSEVSSKDEIIENYKSSMLNLNNTVVLPHSGFSVVFGHVSAYEYLENIYTKIKEIEDMEDDDPELTSRGLNNATLTSIKAFLIPKADGSYGMVKGVDNLIKVISTLNEIDWQVLGELVRISMNPYQFRFALTDLVCPKCHNRSSITIDSLTQLLFIVARSLSNVNVEFKRT